MIECTSCKELIDPESAERTPDRVSVICKCGHEIYVGEDEFERKAMQHSKKGVQVLGEKSKFAELVEDLKKRVDNTSFFARISKADLKFLDDLIKDADACWDEEKLTSSELGNPELENAYKIFQKYKTKVEIKAKDVGHTSAKGKKRVLTWTLITVLPWLVCLGIYLFTNVF